MLVRGRTGIASISNGSWLHELVHRALRHRSAGALLVVVQPRRTAHLLIADRSYPVMLALFTVDSGPTWHMHRRQFSDDSPLQAIARCISNDTQGRHRAKINTTNAKP
jgi:hypothetical protein